MSQYEADQKNFREKEVVILSLKYKKRRVLVKGKVFMEENSCAYTGRYTDYYFRPHNRDKFLKVMNEGSFDA